MADTTPIDQFFGTYRFLSNFWPCAIEYEGEVWPSVEHAYQAAKTLDLPTRTRIRLVRSAGEAKRLGRRVVMRADWEEVKLSIMAALIHEKFKHPALRGRLLATYDRELIEDNTWGDTFWGVCRGVGENHLGKILMAERTSIRAEKG